MKTEQLLNDLEKELALYGELNRQANELFKQANSEEVEQHSRKERVNRTNIDALLDNIKTLGDDEDLECATVLVRRAYIL